MVFLDELERLLARANFPGDAVQFIVENVAQPLGEDQREDEVLELRGLLRTADGAGSVPYPGFELFLLGWSSCQQTDSAASRPRFCVEVQAGPVAVRFAHASGRLLGCHQRITFLGQGRVSRPPRNGRTQQPTDSISSPPRGNRGQEPKEIAYHRKRERSISSCTEDPQAGPLRRLGQRSKARRPFPPPAAWAGKTDRLLNFLTSRRLCQIYPPVSPECGCQRVAVAVIDEFGFHLRQAAIIMCVLRRPA